MGEKWNDLRRVLESAEWTPPTDIGQHGVAHGRSTATLDLTLDLRSFGLLPEPIHNAWWARVEPGGFIVPHIDAGPPYRERWHFPIRPAGFFWENGHAWEPVEPFQVRHWLPHGVWNPTDRERVHLMVERDVIPDDAPTSPLRLQLTPMIPEIAALRDRVEGGHETNSPLEAGS